MRSEKTRLPFATVSTSPEGTTWTVATDRRFLYDGWNLIAEYEGSAGVPPALTATYLWGPDLSGTPQGAGGVGGLLAVRLLSSVSESSVYPAYDGNGNISAWVSGAGALLARMDYSPFGQLIAHYKFTSDAILSRLHFGFSTKYTDPETGLLYYGHRYYDPVNGRWQSRDPIGERGGVNLYGFVGNDGVGRWDILGKLDRDSAYLRSLAAHQARMEDNDRRFKVDLDRIFDAAITRFSRSPTLSSDEVALHSAVRRLKKAYHSVLIQSAPVGQNDYSSFFGAISLSSFDDLVTASHEAVHAFNDINRTGIPFRSWDNEGMAYGFGHILKWADRILELEEEAGKDIFWWECPAKLRPIQILWTNVWQGGVGRKPGDRDKFDSDGKQILPMTNGDYNNIKKLLGTRVSCETAARVINESPACDKCCFRVSCEVGAWNSWFDYNRGYILYQHDRISVDPLFR